MEHDVIPAAIRPALQVQGGGRFPIRRVFCVGRNYWWEAAVAGQPRQRDALFFFMKPADSVVPAEGGIAYPPLTQDFCHEIELVVAIGRDGSDISADHALEHVWGYAAGLDLTRRDMQMAAKNAGQPWEGSKAFDASAPCGPLVSAEQIGHPQAGAIWLNVNGAQRQRSDLAEFIWSVPEVVSFISHSVKLRAGDLIFTGTPTGVGPLLPGDLIEAGIDGVGSVRVQIRSR